MPGIIPHNAPPTAESNKHTYHGALKAKAPNKANIVPITYCPGAPILNNPHL